MALFMFRGTGAAIWLKGAEALDTITADDIIGGFNLSRAFNNIQGLEPSQAPINIAVLEHKTELTLEGPETFGRVTITIVEDDGEGSSQDAVVMQEALEKLDDGEEGVLVLSRTKKTVEAGDTVFAVSGAFGRQTPDWSTDATAATTNCNFYPTSPLEKVTVLPGD